MFAANFLKTMSVSGSFVMIILFWILTKSKNEAKNSSFFEIKFHKLKNYELTL